MPAQPPYLLSAPIPFDACQPFVGVQALPPVGVVARRIAEMAEYYGLIAVPQWYTGRVMDASGLQTRARIEVSQDATEGPFFVTDIQTPSADDDWGKWEIGIQSGSRRLIEGRVRIFDAFQVPQIYANEVLPAPIVVLRGDTLIVSLVSASDAEDTPVPIPADVGVLVKGFVLRTRKGERLGDIADEIAERLRDEGEYYAAGVVSQKSGVSINISSTMIVQSLVAGADRSSSEGFKNPTGLRVMLGNYDAFPPQGKTSVGLDLEVVANASPFDRPLSFQTDLRYPIRAGQRLVVYGEWPTNADVPMAITACVIGRRQRGGPEADK
jgi:hypothetical protein